MSFPTNPAFEQAVIADVESDVPRLAYADWLEENGDPDRAAFIRVQCRVPHVTPADEEWIDLIERRAELADGCTSGRTCSRRSTTSRPQRRCSTSVRPVSTRSTANRPSAAGSRTGRT